MSEIDDLRVAVEALTGRVPALGDLLEITQLVAPSDLVPAAHGDGADRVEGAVLGPQPGVLLRGTAVDSWPVPRVNANLDGPPEHGAVLAPPR
jgi:hypothetical protein